MKFRDVLDKFDNLTITEKWNKETKVAPSKKGMFKGKSKVELEKELAKLKAKQAKRKEAGEKADPAASKKIKEVDFALRAKSGWGKVKESVLKETGTILTESPADTFYISSMKNRFNAMEDAEPEGFQTPETQEQLDQVKQPAEHAPEAKPEEESDLDLATRVQKLEAVIEKLKTKFPELGEEEARSSEEGSEEPSAE